MFVRRTSRFLLLLLALVAYRPIPWHCAGTTLRLSVTASNMPSKKEKKETARINSKRRSRNQRSKMTPSEMKGGKEQNTKARGVARAAGKQKEDKVMDKREVNTTQRRSVRNGKRADKLRHRVDFDTREFSDEMTDPFYHFESNAETSAILWHMNSGGEQFRKIETVLDEACKENRNELTAEEIEKIVEDIHQEVLTDEEVTELLEKYLMYQGREIEDKPRQIGGFPDSKDAHILACGMCGITTVNDRYGRHCDVVPLRELPRSIEFSESDCAKYEERKRNLSLRLPVDDLGNTEVFQVHRLQSCYESKKLHKMFHLHPEFVQTVARDGDTDEEEECTALCPVCSKWVEKSKTKTTSDPPDNSIAAGLDFGDPKRIGLTEPSLPELVLIAKARHFHNVIKVQSNHAAGGRSDYTNNRLRAGSISFRQDSPLVAAIALAYEDIWGRFLKSLTIELVGPEGEQEKLAHRAKMQTLLQGRGYVIYQWLAVLQHVHVEYTNDPKLRPCDFPTLVKDLKTCCRQLIDESVRITDPTSLRAETVVGDDVNQVRTKVITRAESNRLKMESNNRESKTQMAVSYAYVVNTSDMLNEIPFGAEENNGNERERVQERSESDTQNRLGELRQIAEAFNVELPDPDNETEDDNVFRWRSERDSEPINEFGEMHTLLVTAFPTVFMFGVTYKTNSLMKPKQMEHLLLQYTNSAATNRELLFYLFDCQSRHRILHNISAKVKKDPDAFKAYADLVVDDEFQDKIRTAALAPKSDTAKEVLNVVLQVLTIGSRGHFVAGSIGDRTSLERAMACAKRYGPATTLLTVSPDDINNPTSLRLAVGNRDNLTFPAVANDEFFAKLRFGSDEVGKGEVKLPLGYTKRVQFATGNPVAVAREFRSMVENVLQVLIGCPLDFQPGTNSKQVRTWYFGSKEKSSPRQKGVFGRITCYFGCIETQDRGALHFHVILWGGISPRLLEMSTPFPDVCKLVGHALDKMYSATVPRGVHVRDLVLQQMKKTEGGRKLLPPLAKMYSSMRTVPSPTQNKEQWNDYMYHNMIRTGIHEHSFSCKKPPAGAHRCRNGYCCACNGSTAPIFLRLNQSDVEKVITKEITLSEVMPVIDEEVSSVPTHKSLRDYHREPIVPLNDRLIVWELKRTLNRDLTELPLRFTEASERAKSVYRSPMESQEVRDERDAIGQTLDEAKTFVIDEVKNCLGADAAVTGDWVSENTQSAPSIEAWLETQNSSVCVEIYQEMRSKIPTRNGMVVATNAFVCNATGSSSNAILLGNTLQSTCALFYVVPYVCKDRVALDACLVALEAAQRHVAAYPSGADDTGSATRCVQHMFTRVLNNLARSVHVSDTQVALSLLNMGSEISSDCYRYFGATNSVNHFLHKVQLRNDTRASVFSKDGAPVSAALISDSLDPINDSSVNGEDPCAVSHSKKPTGDYGTAAIYKVKIPGEDTPLSVPVHYAKHWWYRGCELRDLTNMEYYAIIDIKLMPTDNTEKKGDDTCGRKKSRMFRFHPNHPLYASHAQYLRSKHPPR